MNAGGGFTSNPYSTAVKFDSTPYLRFEEQRQARQKARDEAVKQSIANFDKDINPAGMHTKDVPAYITERNKYDEYKLANRDKLIAQDATALMELSKMRNRLIGAIDNSKRDVEGKASSLHTLASRKDKTDEDLKAFDEMNSENNNVFSPKYTPINPSRFLKPDSEDYTLDVQTKHRNLFNPITSNPDAFTYGKPKTVSTDPNTGMAVQETNYKIKPEFVPALLQTQNDAYNNTPSIRQNTEKELEKMKQEQVAYNNAIAKGDPNPPIPKLFDKYSKIYYNVTGHNIDPTHKEDIAAAMIFEKLGLSGTHTQNVKLKEPDKFYEHYNYAHRNNSNKSANEELVQIKTKSEPLENNHVFVSNENSADGKKWFKAGMKTAFLPPTLQNTLSTQLTDGEGKTYDFKPKEVIISDDGKYFAPLVKVPMYKNIKTGGMTENPPTGWKETDANVKKVEVVSKPKFWLTEKQMAAEIQKSFPKGEGNVDLGVDEANAFDNPEAVTVKPNTPRARQEAAKSKPKFVGLPKTGKF